jgi:hypothetical protein
LATYKNKEDANADGIYEVTIKATDVQTLEDTNIRIKIKLVSSAIRFYNQDYNYNYSYNYYVNQETEIGGEVPYSSFLIDKADDVTITDISITGTGSEDFNITNNTVTVVNSLTQGAEYNLTINWEDSTGYTGSQNINISVGSNNGNHSDLNITNIEDIHTTQYGTYWYSWYINSIHTNNVAKATLSGVDKDTFINRNRYVGKHSTYFYFSEKNYLYADRPTFQNPKDSDQDNIYETTVTFTDIQSLQTKSLDLTFEMLSHQVRVYDVSYTYPWRYTKEANITDLYIPKEAPIGGELLTVEGAKGFYTRFGSGISISTATLEGDGADNFTISQGDFGNYTSVKLAKSLADSNVTDYNIEVVISDSEGIESRHPLHIHITSW